MSSAAPAPDRGSPPLTEPDFHTVTCVVWSTSGRNVGLGTPDGFLLYSTESILEAGITRAAAFSPSSTPAPRPAAEAAACRGGDGVPSQSQKGTTVAAAAVATAASGKTGPPLSSFTFARTQPPRLQEVCRRVIPGGVGVLSLCGQSSVVAVAGVADRTSASTLRLVDASRPLYPFSSEAEQQRQPRVGEEEKAGAAPTQPDWDELRAEDTGRGSAALSPASGVSPQPQQLFPGAGASRFLPAHPADLRPLILAEASFPASIAAVHFSADCVIVALTGDPRIPGSHLLYVFDSHLQQKLVYSPHPCRSNRYLQDCISLAAAWTPASGAGVAVRRFRALLPAPQAGAVRLLTLRHVAMLPSHRLDSAPARVAATPSPSLSPREQQQRPRLAPPAGSTHGAEETNLFVSDRVLHKAALRAVAIAHDGKHGVTIGESGTKVKLVEFINDTNIVEKLTLERGRTQAIVDSTSLHIIAIPPTSHTTPPQQQQQQQPPISSFATDATSTATTLSGGGYTTRHLVVCITSSGTLHLFLCDTATSTVVYSREKTLCPPPACGFPYAFAAMLPQPMVSRGRCGLLVLQWHNATNAASYLAERERGSASATRATTATAAAHVAETENRKEARLVAFDVAFAFGAPPPPHSPPRHSVGPRSAHSASLRSAPVVPGGVVGCRPFQAYYFPLEK